MAMPLHTIRGGRPHHLRPNSIVRAANLERQFVIQEWFLLLPALADGTELFASRGFRPRRTLLHVKSIA